MPRGGKRPGAGRKAGGENQATKTRKALLEEAKREGVTPLQVMLATMRAFWKDAVDAKGNIVNPTRAMQANMVAKDVARFVHPMLSSVEASVDGTTSHEAALDELDDGGGAEDDGD